MELSKQLQEQIEKEQDKIADLRDDGTTTMLKLFPLEERGEDGDCELLYNSIIELHEAATKYTALLEEKDRELARLTTEAEQSLLLYNNMTATIVKKDEEIGKLKGVLLELWMWDEKYPSSEYTNKIIAYRELQLIIDKAVNTLNTYKQQ